MINEHEELGYITLKQASERFGYSPDYIGQLIRKGKIEGKQVYANVAWMTTVEAMEAYIAGNASLVKQEEGEATFDRISGSLFSERAVFFLTWVLRVLFGILIVAGILVFYFLSITIDEHLSQKAEKELAIRMDKAKAAALLITPPKPVAYGE